MIFDDGTALFKVFEGPGLPKTQNKSFQRAPKWLQNGSLRPPGEPTGTRSDPGDLILAKSEESIGPAMLLINQKKPGYHGTGSAFTARAASTASKARAARAARTARARAPAPGGATTQERQEQHAHPNGKPVLSFWGLARALRALAGRSESRSNFLYVLSVSLGAFLPESQRNRPHNGSKIIPKCSQNRSRSPKILPKWAPGGLPGPRSRAITFFDHF